MADASQIVRDAVNSSIVHTNGLNAEARVFHQLTGLSIVQGYEMAQCDGAVYCGDSTIPVSAGEAQYEFSYTHGDERMWLRFDVKSATLLISTATQGGMQLSYAVKYSAQHPKQASATKFYFYMVDDAMDYIALVPDAYAVTPHAILTLFLEAL